EATLTSLSELLRLALSQSAKQEIPLREELQFVERYLEIQRTRFGDKLQVEQDVDPATFDCLVPSLLLQPLVENAIRHGIEPSDKTCLLKLLAQRHGDRLLLTVEDDGIGFDKSAIDRAALNRSSLPADVPSEENFAASSQQASQSRNGGTGIGL